MHKLLIALAITTLSSTLAIAQTATTTDATRGSGSGNGGQMTDEECDLMFSKAHTSAGTEFSDAEAAPYLDKMSSIKMSTATKGKITHEEFLAACKNGAFTGM